MSLWPHRGATVSATTLTSVLELLRRRLREGTLARLKVHRQCVDSVSVKLLLFRSSVALLRLRACNTLKKQQCPAAKGVWNYCTAAWGGLHTLRCIWTCGEVCRENRSQANIKGGFKFIYVQFFFFIQLLSLTELLHWGLYSKKQTSGKTELPRSPSFESSSFWHTSQWGKMVVLMHRKSSWPLPSFCSFWAIVG